LHDRIARGKIIKIAVGEAVLRRGLADHVAHKCRDPLGWPRASASRLSACYRNVSAA
jgi:hypothetical protein